MKQTSNKLDIVGLVFIYLTSLICTAAEASVIPEPDCREYITHKAKLIRASYDRCVVLEGDASKEAELYNEMLRVSKITVTDEQSSAHWLLSINNKKEAAREVASTLNSCEILSQHITDVVKLNECIKLVDELLKIITGLEQEIATSHEVLKAYCVVVTGAAMLQNGNYRFISNDSPLKIKKDLSTYLEAALAAAKKCSRDLNATVEQVRSVLRRFEELTKTEKI